jgi:LysM repeat protein
MLPLTHSPLRALAPAPLIIGLLAVLGGCNATSPADDPTIRTRFTNLAAQIEQIQTDLDNTRDALADLTQRVENLSNTPRATPSGEIASLRAADQEILQQVADLQRQVAQAAEASRRAQTTTLVTGTPLPPPGEAAAAPTGEAGAPPPVPTHTPGVYHSVAQGETLAQIAQHYGVSAEQIREANVLPPNAQPYPGTQLFIPQGR